MKEIIDRLRVAAGEADGAYAYPFAEIAKVDAEAILTALKAGQAYAEATRAMHQAPYSEIDDAWSHRNTTTAALLAAYEATP